MSTTPNLGTISPSSPQHESLTGVVERLTYHSSESGYSVARLKASGHKDLVTIVGSFPNIQAGQTLKLFGFWREHPKFVLSLLSLNTRKLNQQRSRGWRNILVAG